MAFETLKPHRGFIEALKKDGKTLAQIVERLADEKAVSTTTGTLSRYLASIGSPFRPRELSPQEHAGVDQTVLLTEIFAEMQGAKEENRAVLEHLAGKVAVLSATVEEFEKLLSRARPEAGVIRRIWARAFIVTLLVNAVIAGGVWWVLR